ncbi:MAG: hypothetical protein ACI4TC_02860 [Kiritimatiellia bacterium]
MTPLYFHKSLRNPNINYRSGWWSVSIQVAKNKSLFGAIVGEKVVLNALGRIHFAPTNREHHLGFLMSRFKGGTAYIYGKMRRAGEIEDLGEHLWQRDYWDDLVTSENEFKGWQKYIVENPANWSSDRYGACTAYTMGDTELLNRPRIAFVASQGYYASELRPRRIWAAEAARFDTCGGGASGTAARFDNGGGGVASGSGDATFSERAALAAPVLISTFTSAQEREALRRALAKKRPLVAVFPAGLPQESEMPAGLAAAIREGRALAVSPQAPGSRLNKKIATWCNEFLLKNAEEIWIGDISPNGMLAQMLAGLGHAVFTKEKPPGLSHV